MKKFTRFLAAVSLLASSTLAAAEIMPVAEVRKGMRGYGLSVFDGTTVEKFDVEVLGVLQKILPGQDLILVRVDSEIIRRTGVIAGMSGSPIFLDGRLVGALAYSWQFASEPVAGVTPIESMLRLSEATGGGGGAPSPAYDAHAFMQKMANRDFGSVLEDLMRGLERPRGAGGALPIAVPVSFGAFSSETLDRFKPWFDASGIIAVPAGSSGGGSSSAVVASSETPFAPGDAISGALVTGDFSISAAGTVTWVDGKNIYAFGHPFLDMGEIQFPMAKADVVGLLPNVARSFKFANSGDIVGTFRQDRFAGTYGVVGESPELIPIELTMNGASGSKTYRMSMVRNSQLSPLILGMTADSVVTAAQRAAGERTIVLDSEIDLEGLGTVRLRDGWAGSQARQAIPGYLALVSSYLLSNEFRDTRIERVRLTMHHDDRLRVARLDAASIVPSGDGKVRAGDTVRIRAVLKPYRGEPFVETFDLKVPEATRAGNAHVYVGSGSAFNQIDFTLVPPDPRSLDQVVRVVERLRPSTDLTVALYSPAEGAVSAGVYFRDLPPSVQAYVDADSTNQPKIPVRFQSGEKLARPLDYIVDGAIRIDLRIDPRL